MEDSPAKHLEDTLVAGRGLVRHSAAAVLCDEAPARYADLERLGVRFDADRHGHLALGLEGGHTVRRVVHAGGSATGRRILRQLSAAVVEERRIEVLEDRRVRALLTTDGRVTGVATDDGRELQARATILAWGGAAALWSRTTNPPGSFGSGLLLARAAGAELADLEFVQFHPTAVVGVRAARDSSSPRPSAARARRCTTRTASASSTSSPRATPSPARSTSCSWSAASPRSTST